MNESVHLLQSVTTLEDRPSYIGPIEHSTRIGLLSADTNHATPNVGVITHQLLGNVISAQHRNPELLKDRRHCRLTGADCTSQSDEYSVAIAQRVHAAVR